MAVRYDVNIDETGRPFPHYWELCVGSCHAATLLRTDLQEQIRKAHEEIGFQYIRFHGLLDDDMSVVILSRMPGQKPQLSFFNIDRIFDFLQSIGMKPFIELGFMPEAFASTGQTTFHYKGYSSMPENDSDWENLITELVRHLEQRYGVCEVRSWFFEVWNEPNLRFFFDGSQKDYFHLYEITARAVKSVDPKVRVGGPATSNNAWIPELRKFCADNNVPLDFITTHHYPSDDPLSLAGTNGVDEKGETLTMKFMKMPKDKLQEAVKQFLNRKNENPRDVLYQAAKKAKQEAGDLPLYYTEWNVGHMDTSYAAAGIAATLAYNEGLVEGYSYWCVSDIFEEMGLHGLPFNNEFGLMTVYGIRKPAYRLFQLLHEAGDRRLTVESPAPSRTAEVLALTDDSTSMIFVYNHDIEERDIKAEEIELHVGGQIQRMEKAVIDAGHTNPLAAWEAQGKPVYPTERELAEMEAASCLDWSEVPSDPAGDQGDAVLRFTAEPESVTVFRVIRR